MGMTNAQAKQLGRLVSRARLRRGFSVRGLAERLGISFSWLSKLEAGRYAEPSAELVVRVADELNISPARIDRLMRGAMSDGLPEPRVYFRAKLDLTPAQAEQVERYIKRLRGTA